MFSGYELIIFAAVLLLLFGSARLPKLMRSVGQSVGEFQQGIKDKPETVGKNDHAKVEQNKETQDVS